MTQSGSTNETVGRGSVNHTENYAVRCTEYVHVSHDSLAFYHSNYSYCSVIFKNVILRYHMNINVIQITKAVNMINIGSISISLEGSCLVRKRL